MKITYVAVMYVTIKQVKQIRDLADLVVVGLNGNVSIYATPSPDTMTLEKENSKLKLLIIAYDGDKSTQKRLAMEKQAKVVHKNLKDLTGYVSSVTVDKDEILLSGFQADKAPENHTIPKDRLVIKRVEDGKEVNSAKIFIEKIPAGNFIDRYKVETSSDGAAWALVVETGSSRKLIVPGLKKLVEVFIRVTGGNTYGFSKPSEAVTFAPR